MTYQTANQVSQNAEAIARGAMSALREFDNDPQATAAHQRLVDQLRGLLKPAAPFDLATEPGELDPDEYAVGGWLDRHCEDWHVEVAFGFWACGYLVKSTGSVHVTIAPTRLHAMICAHCTITNVPNRDWLKLLPVDLLEKYWGT